MIKPAMFVSCIAFAIPAFAADSTTAIDTRWVGPDGEIRLPADARSDWTHLGSYVVADPKAPGHGFHDVYTQPGTVQAYQATGQFPDGTVLVKEIRKIGTAAMSTGTAQWATENAVWFVMVKDTKNRFPDNPLWGDGWGWALFEASNPDKNVATSYKTDCLGCHEPTRDNDLVYIQGYPALR